MNQTKVHVFTKPDCPHCARAKRLLERRELGYVEHDVTRDGLAAAASVYHSGAVAVPQIFIGAHHIGGADELAELIAADLLDELLGRDAGQLELSQEPEVAEAIQRGAEDLPLREQIPAIDGSHDDDPEARPLLDFYARFFGFWPNCFAYMRRWPEAYKLFVYAHNIGAIELGRERLGQALMIAMGYASSTAHGCDYCRIHLAAIGGQGSIAAVAAYEASRSEPGARGGGEGGPFGPFELALAELAADASRNQVDADARAKLEALRSQARWPGESLDALIEATSLIAAAFGFLNVFNELSGVAVEGGWAETAREGLGISPGRHTPSAKDNPNNLGDRKQAGAGAGPSVASIQASYAERVGALDAYVTRELGFVPAWMNAWPEALRRHHAYLYVELMGDRAHARLPVELRHLMARVSAIAKGHDALAAAEGLLALRTGPGGAAGLARIERCYSAARGWDPAGFDARERAALGLAWLSAQMPLTTPRRFIAPVLAVFDADELVQLICVCALASMIQRFAAIAKPGFAPEVEAFLADAGLERRTLVLRHRG